MLRTGGCSPRTSRAAAGRIRGMRWQSADIHHERRQDSRGGERRQHEHEGNLEGEDHAQAAFAGRAGRTVQPGWAWHYGLASQVGLHQDTFSSGGTGTLGYYAAGETRTNGFSAPIDRLW